MLGGSKNDERLVNECFNVRSVFGIRERSEA
jgi:hypothetical protein